METNTLRTNSQYTQFKTTNVHRHGCNAINIAKLICVAVSQQRAMHRVKYLRSDWKTFTPTTIEGRKREVRHTTTTTMHLSLGYVSCNSIYWTTRQRMYNIRMNMYMCGGIDGINARNLANRSHQIQSFNTSIKCVVRSYVFAMLLCCLSPALIHIAKSCLRIFEYVYSNIIFNDLIYYVM